MEELEEKMKIDVENALDNFRNMFAGAIDTEELFCCVRELIPVDDYKIKSVEGKSDHFKALLHCKLQTEQEIQNFVELYSKKTSETLRILTAPKRPGKRSLYERIYYYRCHHKTFCQSTMNHGTYPAFCKPSTPG